MKKKKGQILKTFEGIGLVIVLISSMLVLPNIFGDILYYYVGITSVPAVTIISNGLYILVLYLVYAVDAKTEWFNFKNNFRNCMNIGFKYWMLGYVISAVSNLVLNTLVFDNIAANESLVRESLFANPFTAFFSMVIFAPISEEIIFRKGPRAIFKKELYYALFCGLIFGFMHVLADLSWINLLYIIPYGALGYGFAKSAFQTGSTYTSIVMHMFHNLLSFLILILSSMNNLL